MSIDGSNFSPGGTITITVDGQPAIIQSSSAFHSTRSLASLSSLLYQATSPLATETEIVVAHDGTFHATIRVDPDWSSGKPHLLLATEQGSNQKASRLIIPQQAVLVSCSGSTDTITRTLGPVNEGQKQATPVPFVLCTAGSGEVNWSASWDQKQASWLQLTQSGQIQAPLMQQLQLGASAVGLKAGLYSTIVTFSSPDSSTKILLNVMLIVRSANSSQCLNTSPQSLSFTATQGQSGLLPQTVKVTNCGKPGSWTGSTSTSDGNKWLNASPTGSNAKTQNVSITVSSTNLGVGVYTGQVTFKIGSGTAGIVVMNVMLTIVPSNKPCVSANPQSLFFTAFQGQSNPAPQTVTIGNCGSSGSWSASISGANWLSLSSSNGMLNANATQNVSVKASSTGLQTATYTGRITFSMGTSAVTVNVTLAIKPIQPKPCIATNPQALTFTSTQGQGNPAAQTVTLSNCGPADSWSASAQNGSSWLKVSPSTGNLASGATQPVAITLSGNVGAGSYTDQVAFVSKAGAKAFVSVKWTVLPQPPCLQTNPQSLSFAAISGAGNPAPQSVTLINCGSAGTWSGQVSTTDGAAWLNVNPTSGNLTAGGNQPVSVSVAPGSLGQGTYAGKITFTITTGSGGTSQAAVQVSFTISPPPPAHVTVSPTSLDFGSVQQGQTATLPLTIGNTGGQALNWNADTGGAGWVTLDTSSGTVQVNGSQQINVTVNTSQLQDGSNSATLTITSNADNSSVQVSITLTVTAPPQLSVTPTTLTFQGVRSNPCSALPSQTVTLTNAGGGTLTWTVGSTTYTQGYRTGWLTVTPSGPSNAPSTLTFTANPGQASFGTSSAQVIITPSSGPSQTITITLNGYCNG